MKCVEEEFYFPALTWSNLPALLWDLESRVFRIRFKARLSQAMYSHHLSDSQSYNFGSTAKMIALLLRNVLILSELRSI